MPRRVIHYYVVYVYVVYNIYTGRYLSRLMHVCAYYLFTRANRVQLGQAQTRCMFVVWSQYIPILTKHIGTHIPECVSYVHIIMYL